MTPRLAGAIDISLPVFPGMVVYPGECETMREFHLAPGPGQPCTCSHWTMTAHAGTHLDAPRHFVPDGRAISGFEADFFEFRALVVDVRSLRAQGRHVEPRDLPPLDGFDAVLFRTHGGELWSAGAFDPRHTAISAEGATSLAKAPGLRLVGIDYFSVEPFGSNPAHTHLALLGAGLFILEGIDLSSIEPGPHDLLCIPVLWREAEAAPCRALLFKQTR